MALFEGYKGQESIIDIDMETGSVHRSFSNRLLGAYDVRGNIFGVRMIKNGEPMELTGASVAGLFIRPDGSTVPVTGNKYNNEIAYVILPAACYAYSGQFTLSIIITTLSTSATIRIVDGTVIKTAMGSMIDPGSGEVIPDMDGLDAILADLTAALSSINGYEIEEHQISGTRYQIEVVFPEVSS